MAGMVGMLDAVAGNKTTIRPIFEQAIPGDSLDKEEWSEMLEME